ncbi:MAG: hypothetical protein ACI4FY_05685 [Acetatifactor sp.]
MIQEFKLSMRLLKYGHTYRGSLVFGGIFCALGIVLSFLTIWGDGVPMSGYMFAMPAILLLQALWSLSAARFGLVSPKSKRLQTTMPAVLCLFLLTPQYLLVVLLQGLIAGFRPENFSACCTVVIFTAIFVGVVTIYAGFCYKFFFLASLTVITMVCITIPYQKTLQFFLMNNLPANWGTYLLVAVSGLLFIWGSIAVQLGLSRLIYRKPLSRRAQYRDLWQI